MLRLKVKEKEWNGAELMKILGGGRKKKDMARMEENWKGERVCEFLI